MPRPTFLHIALAAGAAVAALAASGCNGTPAGPDTVRLQTDRALYTARDTVAVTVANTEARALTFGVCVSMLERRAGSGWETAVSLPPNGFCNAVALTAPAGGAATFRVLFPGDLAAGEYRWRFRDLGNRATNSFELR